jgi:hypothetical protein
MQAAQVLSPGYGLSTLKRIAMLDFLALSSNPCVKHPMYITTVIEKLASILIAGVNQRTSASSTIFTSMKQVKLKLLPAPTCQVLIFSALRYCRERLDFSKPT